MCRPLTSQVICAARSSFPRDEEDAVFGFLGRVVNRPLSVSIPSCRDKDTRRILELISLIPAETATVTVAASALLKVTSETRGACGL